jgi:hypothetical protein
VPKEITTTLTGYLTYQSKIYAWVFDSYTEKITVKNGGKDIFTFRIYLNLHKQRINNDYVVDRIKKWQQYGTPTPELSKGDPFDGVDAYVD